MKQSYQRAFENLHLFLADTEGEPREKVVERLEAAGIDVPGFVNEIRALAAGQQRRAPATEAPRRKVSRVARFARMTREELIRRLEDLLAESANALPEPGIASREGGTGLRGLTDEELRALAERLENRQERKPEE